MRFIHSAIAPLSSKALAESGVVCNVGKPLRDTAEKKHAIPGGNCQSEISEDIAGNVGKKAKRGRAFRVRCCVAANICRFECGLVVSKGAMEIYKPASRQDILDRFETGP